MSQNQNQIRPGETEVFRITPLPEKTYKTALYTRKIGSWPDERYFTTHTPRHVGVFIKHCQIGQGGGAIHYDLFENNGQRVRIDYTYEGTTCFLEYDPLAAKAETVFAIDPAVSRSSTPDPALFDLQYSSGPGPKTKGLKTTCCTLS